MKEALENSQQASDAASDRRPWQFSLGSLFLLTTIFAVACSLSTKLGLFVILLPLLLLPYWDIISHRRSKRESRQQQKSTAKAAQE